MNINQNTSIQSPTQTLSIQDLVLQIYHRVIRKQHMNVITDLYQLNEKYYQDIVQPFQYTFTTGGKKIRLIFAVIIYQMFAGQNKQGIIPKSVLLIGGLIELLHSASLIIDDIEDNSLQRRGKPASHTVFGIDRSINSANLIYFLPILKLLNTIQSPQQKSTIFSIYIQQMTLSHMGQAQDIQVHKIKSKQQLPSLEEYQCSTIAKTSSLLRMMVKMICSLFNRSVEQIELLCEIMNYVGLAFQVTDDILNLTKDMGKGIIAEDLKQKKFTPIIHYMRNNQQFITHFIKQKKDQTTIQTMLDMIKNSDALILSQKLAENYQQIAQKLITKLGTPYSKNQFEKLIKFIICRLN